MKQNERHHGFIVRAVQPLPEIKATLYRLEYEKNGAEVLWLDNGESNKLFSIAFKTLPSDDTGVFHILEHSVLCGSQKYPVKEPFLELMKCSMNTFLNAMTFPDKTVYPVSSRNETDFLHLMQVYLDAVFCPAIYENPSIFHQEGWHYEWEDADADPIYQGVVFNEMKGAFASVETLIENGMSRLLFPDNCYRFVSGGDPKKIPTLTYEQFLSAHQEFYHPSNARIYLDGAVPIERVLTILDEEYLSRFDRSEVRHEIAPQKPAPSAAVVEYYEIGEEEDAAEKVQMTLGKLVCDYRDRSRILALTVLSSYLTGSNESPLKLAILQNGLAQDIDFSVVDGIAQPYCLLRVVNTEYENRDEIKRAVRETVESLLAGGLDKEELFAAINQLEFAVRESEEPKGLMRNIGALDAWLYGGEPELYLLNDQVFRALRDAVETSYYADLLRSVFLDEANTMELYLLPSKTKGEEDRRAECAALSRARASWSESDVKAILESNQSLLAWQSEPDTPEAFETLPSLPLEEVRDAPEPLPTERLTWDGVPLIFHEISDAGVVHFNLYFSLADLAVEKISAVSFMANLLGHLPTRRHSVSELQRELKRSIGFLEYRVRSAADRDHPERYEPYFAVHGSVLKNSLEDAVELLSEILTETVYDGEQSAASIREILLQCSESMRQDLMENGHSLAMTRALSHCSADGMVAEYAEGYSFYGWMKQFAENFDRLLPAFQSNATSVQEYSFAAQRATLSISSDEIGEPFHSLIARLKKDASRPAPANATVSLPSESFHEIIQIPAGISYAVSAGHLDRFGTHTTGALRILSRIVSLDYLWNEVRVKGGAYDCGFQVGSAGNFGFYSYRDPNPARSLRVYHQTADFVRAFCADGEPLDDYIIGTIASTEPLLSARDQGIRADMDELSGITYEDRKRERAEMLNAKKEDLLAFLPLFENMADKNALCIIGSAEAVKDCGAPWKTYSL